MSGEDRRTGRVNERWKAKGVAWRVGFHVVGAYVFLDVVGLLGPHAQR
ncbi:hypothetical protein ABZO31_28805 [Streptomyces sp. HUAS MG47]